MRLRILAVTARPPRWVAEASAEYLERLPAQWRVEVVEFTPSRRGARSKDEEGGRILAALGPRERLIALDEGGEAFDSAGFARRLEGWLASGRDLAFMIGGADGLSRKCLRRAEHRWSLSPLTLPHGLTRVVLAEQLYRASSLLAGHPYHRA